MYGDPRGPPVENPTGPGPGPGTLTAMSAGSSPHPGRRLSPAEVAAHLGGTAGTADLRRVVSRRRLADAVADGSLRREARGRYALPQVDEGRRAALRLSGVLVGPSAALYWGWAMKWAPEVPEVAVPHKRRLAAPRRAGVRVRWRDLDPAHVVDGVVTDRVTTVLDCARSLPFDEALAVADSALRSGRVRRAQLLDAAGTGPGRGRSAARRVAAAAHAHAANPLESVLRAIALPLLDVVPQVPIRVGLRTVVADLADAGLGIVLEAEGYATHGTRQAFRDDAWRYSELASRGWLVLRFTWEQVMFEAEWVAGVILAAVAARRRCPTCRPV